MHTELDKVFHDENKNSPSDFAFNLLDGKLGNLVGGRELVAQLLPPAAAQQALAQLPGKRQQFGKLETVKKVSHCDFTKIKTCTGHCRIFLHRSPQEGSLGMEVKTLLAFTYSCDLHFRFAFPWYSYSPTLKLRQLDMSRQGMDQGQNLPVYVHWRTGVGV